MDACISSLQIDWGIVNERTFENRYKGMFFDYISGMQQTRLPIEPSLLENIHQKLSRALAELWLENLKSNAVVRQVFSILQFRMISIRTTNVYML